MKQKDLLILGGAGLLAYYFLTKKQQATTTDTGAPGGNLFNIPGVDLSGLSSFWDSIWNSLGSLLKGGPQNLQQSIAAQAAAAANTRWTTQPPVIASTLGFTTYGVYSPTALQANPTLLPAGATMGAQIAELSAQTGAKPAGGALPGQTGAASVGTAYTSSGQAAPVLVVPTANYGGKGADLYTTLDVAIGQKAASAGATTAPTAQTLAQMYATGRI